jgi:hypothetical protein
VLRPLREGVDLFIGDKRADVVGVKKFSSSKVLQ